MGVSLNGGTPKSSILIGFSIINHPYWGTTILGTPHKDDYGSQSRCTFGSCQYRRNVIDQVVSTALPESTNADEA